MASRVATLLLLGIICFGLASAEIAVDCCLSSTGKFLPRHVIVSYNVQEAGRGCEISATMFLTKAGKKLCVSHPNNSAWVKNHIDYLDKKRQHQ